MFLSYIKDFSLKRLLKNSYQTIKINQSVTSIKSVGLLIDESYFSNKEALVDALINSGFKKDKIDILVFNEKLNAIEGFVYPTFSNKHVSWNGNFTDKILVDFINNKYDLLISFYELEKPILMLVTNQSEASFKVGFSSIDKRCNNLMIATNAENYKVFVFELFKYLKILKKI